MRVCLRSLWDPNLPSGGQSSPNTGRKLRAVGPSEGRCREDRGCQHPGEVRAPNCVQTPSRRWWLTGLPLTHSQAEADCGHGPGAWGRGQGGVEHHQRGGLASWRSIALCPGWPALPCSASPRTTKPASDYRFGCQGHVQGTFQLWNKMSKEGQGPSLSVQEWGRGAVAKSSLSLWEPANSHERMRKQGLTRHARSARPPNPRLWAQRGGHGHSTGGLASWPAHQRLPETRSLVDEQWAGTGAGRASLGGLEGRKAGSQAEVETLTGPQGQWPL